MIHSFYNNKFCYYVVKFCAFVVQQDVISCYDFRNIIKYQVGKIFAGISIMSTVIFEMVKKHIFLLCGGVVYIYFGLLNILRATCRYF